jgi:hypothetical protein
MMGEKGWIVLFIPLAGHIIPVVPAPPDTREWKATGAGVACTCPLADRAQTGSL